MELKKHARILALTLSGITLLATSLPAASLHSGKVSIPFSFEVQHSALPAGEYRVEQTLGSGIATLVNLKTGQQADVICTHTHGEKEKMRLVFEAKPDGRQHLRSIS